MSLSRRWNTVLLAIALAAAATILAVQLFVPPVIGLADNGDSQRVIGYAGFQHSVEDWNERYFSYVRTTWKVAPVGWFRFGYHSSETLLAFAARYLHLAFVKGPIFDIRLLAGIHVALFLAALALLIRACRDLRPVTQTVVAGLLVFVFTDVGYVAPFNSWYSQVASLLFLLLTAGVAAEGVRRGRLSGLWLLAYFGFAVLFVGSKPQEKLAAPLLALYGLRLAGLRPKDLRPREAWRHFAVWLAAGLVAFMVVYGRHVPYRLRESMIFQVVFDDLLAHSPSPEADIRELGLDPDWLRYTGKSAYSLDSPLMQPSFRTTLLRKVGYRRLMRFYLSHPSRIFGRIQRTARHAWILRPVNYGNFEKSAGHPPLARTTRFSAWSRTLSALSGQPLVWMTLLFGGNLAAAFLTYRRAPPGGRLFRESLVLAVAMAGLAFSVCAFAQTPPDAARSLYAFHALCDLLLIADAAWLLETVLGKGTRPGEAAA